MTEELDEIIALQKRILSQEQANTELLQLLCELKARDLDIRHLMGPELKAKVNAFKKREV